MRRVAAGEANQTDGLLYKGLPLRVLSDNDLILKDDIGIAGPQRTPRAPDMSYLEEDDERGEILSAVLGILQNAHDEIEDLAGNTATIPGRGGPEAAAPAFDAAEKLLSLIEDLEEADPYA
mgnify:CR=1 FL=1|tara:strand:+ start:702 stop:1064 length:363 start_codon:yes stop_codon:yes gene_type:complete